MSEISVIVHDPVPDETAPITADEMKGALEALGYHVQNVLVRQDYPPPYWLVKRDIDKHLGPFSSRLDACTALDLIPSSAASWDVLGDEEFKTYLDVRAERRQRAPRLSASTATLSAERLNMETSTQPTLNEQDELDALPEGTIIRANNGHAYEKSMQFTMVGRRWFEAGNSSPERSADIPLPATLLYIPDYVRRGPTEAEWGKAIDESWAWFEKNLGRTPCAYDVQMWIDGYAPRS